MKQFIAFVKKEFYHIFRDRRTMLILLGMPVVQIILFGFAISTEVKNVRLAVLDPSNDVVTRKIIDRLDASEYFTVTRRFHSPREMEAAFLKNKIDMVVVFNEHFADGLYCGDARVQLIVDATDPNMSTSQINYATGIVSAVGQEMISPGISSSARLTPDIKLLYNPQMKSAYNFVPGVMGLILMLICAMMTSISIVREKETGTMEVLLVSPVKPLFIILAKAVPYFVLSFVNLVTILLFCICTGCTGSGQPVLVGGGVFAVYFCLVVVGIADFIGNTYTSGGYAGFRHDSDDAYHGVVRYDFPCGEYAVDSSVDIGYYSGPLVYPGCT